MGDSPQPDYSGAGDQAQHLYSQVQQGYKPSGALGDYINSFMTQQYNQGGLSGLGGSSIQAANTAQGIGQAYNQGQQQYMQNVMGLYGNILQGNVATQQENQMMPYQMLGAATQVGAGVLPFL